MLVSDWLTELNCEVAGSANSMAAAVQMVESVALDAALLDVNLGSDNSFALADTLVGAGVPIAFITGRDSESLPERLRSAPVLCKPFDFAAIEQLLGRLFTADDQPVG